jgi:hypothetical protein
VVTHAPAVQVPVAPVHTFPQVPQLFGSFCRSEHPLLHSVGVFEGQMHVLPEQLCPAAQA